MYAHEKRQESGKRMELRYPRSPTLVAIHFCVHVITHCIEKVVVLIVKVPIHFLTTRVWKIHISVLSFRVADLLRRLMSVDQVECDMYNLAGDT